jgi:hypothetical protein
MSPHDVYAVACPDRRYLLRSWSDHQKSVCHTHERNEKAETQRPREGAIRHTLTNEQDGHKQIHRPDKDNEDAHRDPQQGVQRCRQVEMTGCATRCLRNDDRYFDSDAYCGNVCGQLHEVLAILHRARQT